MVREMISTLKRDDIQGVALMICRLAADTARCAGRGEAGLYRVVRHREVGGTLHALWVQISMCKINKNLRSVFFFLAQCTKIDKNNVKK